MQIAHPPPTAPHAAQQNAHRPHAMTTAVVEFEAMVISQFLQHAGLNKDPGAFGGGAGEAQFASFLTEIQSTAIAKNGGIGLSERLLRAVWSGQDDAP